VNMYKAMTRQSVMDQILNDSQRQGRITFYMTCSGEEGAVIGSAAALEHDDVIYSQYRESGLFMYLGFSFEDFISQSFSNMNDPAKGRQMPMHYGSKKFNIQTISSPLGTIYLYFLLEAACVKVLKRCL